MSRPLLAALLIGAGVAWLLMVNPVAVFGLVGAFMLLWVFRRK